MAFRPVRRITIFPPLAASNDATQIRSKRTGSIQIFPWTDVSALFGGKWLIAPQWRLMVAEFSTSFAISYHGALYILRTDERGFESHSLDVTDATDPPRDDDTPQVAWALRSTHPFDPLVLMTRYRRVFIWNVRQRKIVGYARGHGGRITSITIHPTSPNIFATTSSDFTTRIYDLDQLAKEKEDVEWLPWTGPFRGSSAHGADGADSEGSGLGRCTHILAGGRSGGHSWDVTAASFHPRLPLIATCGADRYVKIWRVFSKPGDLLVREDKPLFSARVTTSGILSIAWLADDILILHTSPTLTPLRFTREQEDETCDGQEEEYKYRNEFQPGTLDCIQWLGLKRFFPGGDPDPVLRGGASDYQESKTYTVISTEKLVPPQPENPCDFFTTLSHPPIPGLEGSFLVAFSDSILVSNTSKFLPKSLSSYEHDARNDTLFEVTKMTKRIRLDSEEPDNFPPDAAPPEVAPQEPQFNEEINLGSDVAACALAPSSVVVLLGWEGVVCILKKRSRSRT
ncbi:hypothetical protein C8R43DRAFT_1029729 [Mycena crocata]|nr:hypothetical protein C8R43DRAFT_1029729 [Mycena crocata]